MPIYDFLVHRDADPDVEGFLPHAEILQQVGVRFPLAIIDLERGDQMVREHGERLSRLSAPEVVLDSWQKLLGQVAYVTIREEENGPGFGFFLDPRPTLIEIVYEQPGERETCRPLLESLAEQIGYDIQTEDLPD